MKTSERSRKAREAHAESLLKVSNSLVTAFFVTILILPMAAVIKSFFGSTSNIPFSSILTGDLFIWKMGIFLFCEFAVAGLAQNLKNRAFDIYDELSSDLT